VLISFTSLQNMILSIIVIVHAGVKSANVICPHYGMCDLCIFAVPVLWTWYLCAAVTSVELYAKLTFVRVRSFLIIGRSACCIIMQL